MDIKRFGDAERSDRTKPSHSQPIEGKRDIACPEGMACWDNDVDPDVFDRVQPHCSSPAASPHVPRDRSEDGHVLAGAQDERWRVDGHEPERWLEVTATRQQRCRRPLAIEKFLGGPRNVFDPPVGHGCQSLSAESRGSFENISTGFTLMPRRFCSRSTSSNWFHIASVTTTPAAPARAVRPARWRYVL